MRTTIRSLASFVAFALLAPSVAVGAAPAGTDYGQAYLPSADGTRLHADVLCPADLSNTSCVRRGSGERTAVLLEVGPYQAHGAGSPPILGEPPPTSQPVFSLAIQHGLFARGYSTVYVDERGFGGSGGCWDNYGPGTAADVNAAVQWAASQPWSNGKVGIIGFSASATTAVMALATHPPGLAAAAPMSPLVDAYSSYFMNGVHTNIGLLEPATYNLDYAREGGSIGDDPAYHEAYLGRTGNPRCVDPTQIPSLVDADPRTPFWRERAWLDAAATSPTPVFGEQGFLEWNVPPDQGLSLFPRLRNLQGLWLGQFAHEPAALEGPTVIGRGGAGDALVRFFDHNLLGAAPEPSQPVVVQEAPDLTWRTEDAWPPADAEPFTLPIRPGSYLDQGANGSGDDEDFLGSDAPFSQQPIKACEFNSPAGPTPAPQCGTWTVTPPLPYDVHLAGFPRLRLRAHGRATAHICALLYDVSPNGSALFVSRGASVVGTGHIHIRMHPQDWRLAAGHRLGLLIAGGDDNRFVPATAATPVQLISGSLTLPVLQTARNNPLDGGRGQRWDEIKHPVQLDPATITAATEHTHLPPPMRTKP